MRPNELSTVKVFSPCGLIGDADYLKVSLIRRVLAKKKKTSIDVLRVLEGRERIIPRRYFNLRYIRWIAVVTNNFYWKTSKINDTLCAVFFTGHVSYKIHHNFFQVEMNLEILWAAPSIFPLFLVILV